MHEKLRGSALLETYSLKGDNAQTHQCLSIIVVAGFPDIDMLENKSSHSIDYNDDEEFLCELSDGHLAPIRGTIEQFERLRSLLNDGALISAESAIEMDAVDLPFRNANVQKGHGTRSRWARKLQSETNYNATYERAKKVLVVSVTDINGLHPDSPELISDKIFGTFGDPMTVKSQLAACSFDKLQFTNEYSIDISKHLSAPGVVEVEIPVSLYDGDRNVIRDAAVSAIQQKLGLAMPGPFDHVMFILEGCYNNDCNWGAYAFVNSYLSVFKGNSYKYVGVAVHEIGHNLNLAHSRGLGGNGFDLTCTMGSPLYRDNVGAMCYNPAKNFQLARSGSSAWYNDHLTDTQVWNSGTAGGTQWSGKIIGIADYNNNPEYHPVVVKIESGTPQDIFIGFNRVKGATRDTTDGMNKVTIVQAGADGLGYSQSLVQATLNEGESHVISDWRGSGLDLIIIANEIILDIDPAYAEVSVSFGVLSIGSALPTLPPLLAPIPSSINSPSLFPTHHPQHELLTTDEFDSGSNGSMFSLKAMRDVQISSLAINAMSRGIGAVKVYTRKGSYLGMEEYLHEWELIYDNPSVIHLRRGEPTLLGEFDHKVFIAKGSTNSFYVTSTNGLVYKKGEKEGSIVASDNSLIVYEGIGMLKEFSTRIAPRVWNDIIFYGVVGTAIVSQYGNGHCGSDESSLTCASDCITKTLETTFDFDSGSNGNMFTVKALRDVSIYSLDVNAMTGGAVTGAVKVLTRSGSYQGHESSPSGWKVVYDRRIVTFNNRGKATELGNFDEVVDVSNGSFQSFYVWAENSIVYKKGAREGKPFASDSSLIIYEGIGVRDYFGPFISPRVWSGAIRYETSST
ncbi:hypothetical protein HJC23_006408 [Cyclotella cryptica]|uniref:Peptidase M11 gametolysin domain-containing protein n=1 Tax=Cyclotella cryptica TaxID=29204 RepID=A0ABD3QUN8_9STRA